MSNIQTGTIQNIHGQSQHIIQEMPSDYTGIFCFCGTIFISVILILIIVKKIANDFKYTYYKIEQEKILKNCQGIIGLNKNIKELILLLKKEEKND